MCVATCFVHTDYSFSIFDFCPSKRTLPLTMFSFSVAILFMQNDREYAVDAAATTSVHQQKLDMLRRQAAAVAANFNNQNQPGGKGSSIVGAVRDVIGEQEVTVQSTLPGVSSWKANEPGVPPIDGCKKTYAIIVLHWDPHWGPHIIPHGLAKLEECKSHCFRFMHTSDRSYADRADIIEFHDWGGSPPAPQRSRPTQLFMYTTMESPLHSGTSNDGLMSTFNLIQSYHLDSDVRSPYLPTGPDNVPVVRHLLLCARVTAAFAESSRFDFRLGHFQFFSGFTKISLLASRSPFHLPFLSFSLRSFV